MTATITQADFDCYQGLQLQNQGQMPKFVDTQDCLSTPAVNNGLFKLPQSCCHFYELYQPAVQKNGLFCTNPSFSFAVNTPGASCYSYQSNGQTLTACPTAGIIDALSKRFSGADYNWGYGFDPHTAYYRMPACFDETPAQQLGLYTLTQQFCPNLPGTFSYTSDLQFLYNTDSIYNNTYSNGNVIDCCLRDNQADPILPNKPSTENKCHMMLCHESPVCSFFLRDFCSFYGPDDPNCAKWLSYSANDATSVIPGSISIPASGANPASVDQALFTVLDYCSSKTNDLRCDAILALGGGLLFPRLDSLHLSDFVTQLAIPNPKYVSDRPELYPLYIPNTATFQTVTFQITNLSNVIISSLSVYQTSPFYTVSFANQTILPMQSTNCTVTTTLTQNDDTLFYQFSRTDIAITDGYNLDNACQLLGIFNQNHGASDATTHSKVPDYYYAMPACANGDNQVGPLVSFTTDFTFSTESAAKTVFPCGNWNCVPWALDWKHQFYPGCIHECEIDSENCKSGGNGIFNPQCDVFRGECAPKKKIFTTVTTLKTCSTQKYGNHPFYFYDSNRVDLTDPTNINRQDYSVLGGFAASIENNFMDLSFSTKHLIVLPLSNAATMAL